MILIKVGFKFELKMLFSFCLQFVFRFVSGLKLKSKLNLGNFFRSKFFCKKKLIRFLSVEKYQLKIVYNVAVIFIYLLLCKTLAVVVGKTTETSAACRHFDVLHRQSGVVFKVIFVQPENKGNGKKKEK